MKDLGLFLISTFSVFIAVFVGANLVYKEIERKTIFTIVPKPIFRAQFLLGKYFGVAATMFVQVAIMGLVFSLQFWLLDEGFGLEMVQALWLVYVEVLVVSAVALLFSSFSTPFLSGLLTLGVFVVGRFVDRLLGLRFQPERGEEPAAALEVLARVIRGIAHVAPDLSLYNVTPYLVYEQSVEWRYVLHGTTYGLSYAAIALLVASVLFTRRDFV